MSHAMFASPSPGLHRPILIQSLLLAGVPPGHKENRQMHLVTEDIDREAKWCFLCASGGAVSSILK